MFHQNILKRDTFLVNQPLGENLYLYKGEDTLRVTNSVFLDMIKFKGKIGGYYPFYFQSINGNKLLIYRFKGYFDSNIDVEVRTVLNFEGKLAGFFIKPWKEEL